MNTVVQASTVRAEPWDVALRQFSSAAGHLRLEAGMREVLAHPERELTVPPMR